MSTLLLHPQSLRLTDGLERDLMRQAYAAPQPTLIGPALKAVARTISRAARTTWEVAVEVGEMRAARAIQQRQYWY